MKKVISILLSLVMAFSVCGTALSFDAYALDTSAIEDYIDKDLVPAIPTDKAQLEQAGKRMLFNVIQAVVDVVVKTLEQIIPTVNFPLKEEFEFEDFYPGMSEFLTEPAQGAVWSIGYGSGSIQTGDELDGNHMVAGSLSLDKSATAIHDDQRVRVIAMNDGSGRGTVVFAVLDAFGLSSGDVQGIRASIADFAKANNIVGVNISVLHQHSCVDTFGMNGNLLKMVFFNPVISFANNYLGKDYDTINGQNKSYMENLYKVTGDAIKQAVGNMTQGKLFYSKIEAGEYMRDKRTPYVNDPYIHLFRFVPSDGSRETWICNSAIHCVGNGAAGTEITGDYPYYVEKVINERANADYILIQGAELAITSNYEPIEDEITPEMSRYEKLVVYGTALGNLIVDSDAPEKEVKPILNYKADTYFVTVNNSLLSFLGKMGALTNNCVSLDNNQFNVQVATEIGYLELGDELAIAIIPGELEPTIAYGGSFTAAESWRGTDFNYPSMQEIVGDDKELLVFGLSNDQIGYILADNDYRSLFTENEEIVSTGSLAGSATVEAFMALVESK